MISSTLPSTATTPQPFLDLIDSARVFIRHHHQKELHHQNTSTIINNNNDDYLFLHVDLLKLCGFDPFLGRLALCEQHALDYIFSRAFSSEYQEFNNKNNNNNRMMISIIVSPQRNAFPISSSAASSSSPSSLQFLTSCSLVATSERKSLEDLIFESFDFGDESGNSNEVDWFEDDDDGTEEENSQEELFLHLPTLKPNSNLAIFTSTNNSSSSALKNHLNFVCRINTPLTSVQSSPYFANALLCEKEMLFADEIQNARAALTADEDDGKNNNSNNDNNTNSIEQKHESSSLNHPHHHISFLSVGENIFSPLFTYGRVPSTMIHIVGVISRVYAIRRPGSELEFIPMIKIQQHQQANNNNNGNSRSSSSASFDFSNPEVDVVLYSVLLERLVMKKNRKEKKMNENDTTTDINSQHYDHHQDHLHLQELCNDIFSSVEAAKCLVGLSVDIAGRVGFLNTSTEILEKSQRGTGNFEEDLFTCMKTVSGKNRALATNNNYNNKTERKIPQTTQDNWNPVVLSTSCVFVNHKEDNNHDLAAESNEESDDGNHHHVSEDFASDINNNNNNMFMMMTPSSSTNSSSLSSSQATSSLASSSSTTASSTFVKQQRRDQRTKSIFEEFYTNVFLSPDNNHEFARLLEHELVTKCFSETYLHKLVLSVFGNQMMKSSNNKETKPTSSSSFEALTLAGRFSSLISSLHPAALISILLSEIVSNDTVSSSLRTLLIISSSSSSMRQTIHDELLMNKNILLLDATSSGLQIVNTNNNNTSSSNNKKIPSLPLRNYIKTYEFLDCFFIGRIERNILNMNLVVDIAKLNENQIHQLISTQKRFFYKKKSAPHHCQKNVSFIEEEEESSKTTESSSLSTPLFQLMMNNSFNNLPNSSSSQNSNNNHTQQDFLNRSQNQEQDNDDDDDSIIFKTPSCSSQPHQQQHHLNNNDLIISSSSSSVSVSKNNNNSQKKSNASSSSKNFSFFDSPLQQSLIAFSSASPPLPHLQQYDLVIKDETESNKFKVVDEANGTFSDEHWSQYLFQLLADPQSKRRINATIKNEIIQDEINTLKLEGLSRKIIFFDDLFSSNDNNSQQEEEELQPSMKKKAKEIIEAVIDRYSDVASRKIIGADASSNNSLNTNIHHQQQHHHNNSPLLQFRSSLSNRIRKLTATHSLLREHRGLKREEDTNDETNHHQSNYSFFQFLSKILADTLMSICLTDISLRSSFHHQSRSNNKTFEGVFIFHHHEHDQAHHRQQQQMGGGDSPKTNFNILDFFHNVLLNGPTTQPNQENINDDEKYKLCFSEILFDSLNLKEGDGQLLYFVKEMLECLR